MADLAASDVTITVEDRSIAGAPAKRHCRVKITFGDGAKTYPSGGVPLPSAGSFGLVRNLDFLSLIDADDAQAVIWKYDKDNNKLRGYWPSGGAGTPPVAMGTDHNVTVAVPTGATAVTSTAAQPDLTETVLPGQGKEFVAATTTIPATTLYAEAVGWGVALALFIPSLLQAVGGIV